MIGKKKRIRRQLRQANKPGRSGDLSANPKYLASCYGKIRHTKESAKKAAAEKPEIVKFYKCKFCEYYHIGRKQ